MLPDLIIQAEPFALLSGPIVYVLRDASGTALYVGASARGLSRLLDGAHHAIGQLQEGERFDVHYCASAAEALAIERRLIEALSPARNQRRGRNSNGTGRSLERGIAIQRNGRYRAFVRVSGRLHAKTFQANTPLHVMREWRKNQRAA